MQIVEVYVLLREIKFATDAGEKQKKVTKKRTHVQDAATSKEGGPYFLLFLFVALQGYTLLIHLILNYLLLTCVIYIRIGSGLGCYF